jgi:hypothetical protein
MRARIAIGFSRYAPCLAVVLCVAIGVLVGLLLSA